MCHAGARMQGSDTDGEETLVGEETGPERSIRERALERGDVIGRYSVLEKVGAGGMGVVYAAYDPELDRKVALKVLYPQLGSTEATEGEGRLLREAQAMARLAHPNVVTVHDVGEHDGRVFLAMEFIEGETLEQWLERKRPWPEILAVFVQAGHGLAAAHDKGLVHRDFKPENVMLDGDGRVRVMDFGLARPSGPDIQPTVDDSDVRPSSDLLSQELTGAGALMGTPAYMAPEQHLKATVGAPADQFSFCVALYRGLFDERPFKANNAAALALQVTTRDADPPPKGTDVPARIQRAVLRGLSRMPESRFENMRALLRVLEIDHAAKRRRLGGLLVTAVGAGAVFWAVGSQAGKQSPCEDVGQPVEGVWNEEARAAVRAAMVEAAPSYGDQAWERVEPWLDEYAEGWSVSRTDACEATRVRGEQSEQLMDRRMICLDDRLEAFTALIEILREADDAVVRRAIAAATQLPSLARCSDAAALMAELEPPDDPAVAELVATTRATLARAKAQKLAGKYDSARELVEGALEEAEGIGYEPLQAEALMSLGGIQMVTGEPEQAEETLTRGYALSIRIGHRRAAGQTASALVQLVGYKQAKYEPAKVWAIQALALAETDGDVLPMTIALNAVGLAADRGGDYDEAEARHREALELKRKHFAPNDPSIGTSLNNLANVAQAKGDYELATKLHTEVHKAWVVALGSKHPNVGSVLNNLGIDAKRQGDYQAAADYYAQALRIFETSLGPRHPQTAMALNNKANVANELKRYAEARKDYERAWELLAEIQGPEHSNVGVVLGNLGTVALAQDDYSAAEDYQRRSLAILEAAHGVEHPRVASALTGLGRALLGQKRFEEAIDPLERALAIRGEGEVDPGVLAETRAALGRALWGAPKSAGASRSRARELVGQAEKGYAEAGEAYTHELGEVRKWLASH